MDFRFDGKRALVTGAGKGIGRAIALKLANLGAEVIAVSRTESDLDSLKMEFPTRIRSLLLDIAYNWEVTQRLVQRVGAIDLLVNNAACMCTKYFHSLTEDDVKGTMGTNFNAIVNVTQVVANGMKERGKGGSIVNISSVLGISGYTRCCLYCASKAAVDQLTRSLAVELGPHKIRVNSVNPSVVRTRMYLEPTMFESGYQGTEATLWLQRTPLNRFSEVNDVVYPVLFLLSDFASMITGVVLPVDGGILSNISGAYIAPFM